MPVDFERNIGSLIRSAITTQPITSVRDKNNNVLGFVETTVIESKQGVVVPVINWSNRDVKDAVMEIKMDMKGKNLSLASGKPVKKINTLPGKIEIVFDIEIADAIIIR